MERPDHLFKLGAACQNVERTQQPWYRFLSVLRNVKNLARLALGRTPPTPQEELAYIRLASKGFAPAGIIDVGAYEGNWTRLALRVFPGTPVLMVEAQEAKRAILERVCCEHHSVSYVSAVLGRQSGMEVPFFEMETGSSMMPENSNAPRKQHTVVTRALDEFTPSLSGPLFLKIDVQGSELDVLAGGRETLRKCELVQLEVAILEYNSGAPRFLDVIKTMDRYGFVPYDFSGFSRPDGRELVQVDILFVRASSELRPSYFIF